MSDGQSSPHDPAHLLALNAALRAENENLKAVVESLTRALYGARSERQLEPANRLPLALNDLSAAPVEPAKLPHTASRSRWAGEEGVHPLVDLAAETRDLALY